MYIFIQSLNNPVTRPATIYIQNVLRMFDGQLVNASFKRSTAREQLRTSLQFLTVNVTFIIYLMYIFAVYTVSLLS